MQATEDDAVGSEAVTPIGVTEHSGGLPATDADPIDDPELDDNGGQWWPLRTHIAAETREIQKTWSVGERNGRGTGRIPLAPEELAALPAAVPFKPRLRLGEFDEAACRALPDVGQAVIAVLAGRELWSTYVIQEIQCGEHDAALLRIFDALADREAAQAAKRKQSAILATDPDGR